MKRGKLIIGQKCLPLPKDDLVQHLTGLGNNRKRPRTNLDK
jgi:hypothetical protein